MKKIYLYLTAAVLASASSAHAQSSERAGANNQVEVVVITAQKRRESIQKSALAVSAISGDALNKSGIHSMSDLQGLAPNTQFQPNQNNSISVTVRGVSTNNVQITGDPAVAFNYDGVSILHPIALPGGFFDIDRVEVLRGPQGTIYGRNATGGAVNVITRRPTKRLEGDLQVGVGNYNAADVNGVINIPLGDRVATRTVVQYAKHDGYNDDGQSDLGMLGVRENILLTVSDDLQLLIGADYTHRTGKGAGFSLCPPGSSPGTGIPYYCGGVEWKPWAGNPQGVSALSDNFLNTKSAGVHAELTWERPWGTLTYIPAYREVHNAALGLGATPDKSTIVGINTDNNSASSVTHELRLNSPAETKIKWVAGLYYLSDRVLDQRYSDTNAPFLGAGGVDVHHFSRENGHYKSTSYAGFAQLTYPVTDKVRLTGGLRYTSDDKVSTGTTTVISRAGSLVIPDDGEQKSNNVSWKLGVEGDVAPQSMMYASVSTGYKAGGFNGGLKPNTFPAEKISAIEIGSKNRFFDQRVQLNLTAFYYDYSNYQFQYFGTVNSAAGPIQQTITSPADKATISGEEAEFIWRVTSADRVDATVSHLSTNFDKFVIGGKDFSGTDLPYSPDLSVAAGYDHTFTFATGATLVARIQSLYNTAQWVYYDHSVGGSKQPAYTKSDFTLTYNSAKGNWSLSAWVRNIENDWHITNFLAPTVISATSVFVAAPRTFGATIARHF